jgi:hypothetical protein
MTIGFAGSRCVDERRRRRLAQEVEQETPAERRSPSRAHAQAPSTEPPEPFVPASPIESIVRPQLWVSILFTLLGLAAWGGILVLGDWVDRTHQALSAAFGLRNGLLVRSISAGSLLIAAQLSYVILWHRVRSRKDFSGRYKVWAWIVPTWLVFAFAAATDAHWLAGRAAQARWPMNVRDMAALVWLVPAAAVLLALTRLLRLEMRKCRVSVWCLRLSMLSAAVAAATLLGGHLITDTRTAFLIGSVSSTFWPVGLVISFWYYARHVIHVTNEPAELPQSATATERVGGRLSKLRTWWSERSAARAAQRAERDRERAAKRAAAAASKEAARVRAAEELETESESAPPARIQPPVTKPVAPARGEPPRVAPAPAVSPKAAPIQPVRPTAAVQPARPTATPRPAAAPATVPPSAEKPDFDSDDDAEDDAGEDGWSDELQGLSKKERKRLRKLQRQRQRVA